MREFSLILENELFKLRRKSKYFIMLIIGAAFCMLRLGGSALISKFSGGDVVIKSNMILEMMPFLIEILVPIMMLTAASDLFCGEFSSDTMKFCLLKPATRFKVLAAKTTAIVLLGASSLIVMYIVCLAIQLISGGSAEHLAAALAAYIIDIIPLIGIALLGVLVNVCLKGPSAALLLSLAAYAVMKYMGFYVAGASSFLFTSYARWHTLFFGAGLPFNIILYKIGIVLGSILILFSVSYIIFDRRDI